VSIRGTRLDRAQVLSWNRDWSQLDRVRIGDALDQFPDWAIYNLPPAKGEIGVWIHGSTQSTNLFDRPHGQERWHRGLIIHRGWLEWPGGAWSNNLDRSLFPEVREGEKDIFECTRYYEWYPLSTFAGTGARGATNRLKAPAFCPTCHLALPANGICDDCS
jgi:hypothetical protein